MEIKALKVDLLCWGARASGLDKGMRAGAEPAAGGMCLFGGTVVNVPTQSCFVAQSPYKVEAENGGRYVIKREYERFTEVRFPQAKFQELKTKEGIPFY